MEQQQKKKKEMNYRKIEFERFARDIIARSISISIRFETRGRKKFRKFFRQISATRVTIKVSMNVLKANRRELGRVNRESCGISIEFIHAGQSYHRLGQSLCHLIPNTFPMVAVY